MELVLGALSFVAMVGMWVIAPRFLHKGGDN